MPLARAAAAGDGEDHRHVGGIDLLLERDADGPGQAALAQRLPERRAQAISGIGQHAAEAHAGGANPVDLGQRDLGLGPVGATVLGHAGTVEPGGIARPALGQEQPQPHHHRHLARGQRQRHQRLAVGVLAKRRGILRRDADRVAALLGQRGVVDDQPGIVPANLSVGLGEQRLLQRRGIPDAARDEVVQLVIADACVARRHRLDALAIARADQPGNIGRAHPRPASCASTPRRTAQASAQDRLANPCPWPAPPTADLP